MLCDIIEIVLLNFHEILTSEPQSQIKVWKPKFHLIVLFHKNSYWITFYSVRKTVLSNRSMEDGDEWFMTVSCTRVQKHYIHSKLYASSLCLENTVNKFVQKVGHSTIWIIYLTWKVTSFIWIFRALFDVVVKSKLPKRVPAHLGLYVERITLQSAAISSQTATALSYTKSVESFNIGIVQIHARNSEAENELYAFRERFWATFKIFLQAAEFPKLLL